MTGCAQRVFPPLPHTLDIVLEDHLIQRILCRDLEAVADGLPVLPPLPAIRRLCDRIKHVATSHFARAEHVFATLPAGCQPDDVGMRALHHMHRLDETHAEDLVAALWEHTRRTEQKNVEQLAYMLRCFFDGCQRAIALKESWIAGNGLEPIRLD